VSVPASVFICCMQIGVAAKREWAQKGWCCTSSSPPNPKGLRQGKGKSSPIPATVCAKNYASPSQFRFRMGLKVGKSQSIMAR